ncbi:MAG: sporulation transcription factor Spo0A [Clostridia bacterium]|nr:sporulation transcription factor Spo0A [Clostridia bacterium]
MDKENKIKIYLADTDTEQLSKIENYFSDKDEYLIVGKNSNGEQVLADVLETKPDFLISEVLLGGMDGFKILQSCKQQLGEKAPKVIFASNLSHAGFISKAMKEGASYFMVKPLSPENLEERIIDLSHPEEIVKINDRDRQLDEKISNIFISIGIPAHIKGYQFLREAVKLAVDEPDIIASITKKLYPTIAEKFSTSSSKVERGMRHAIEVAWNRGKIENINNLFGLKIYGSNDKPTNGELIALIADKMIMEG